MLDISQLQTAKVSNEQIAIAKLLYRDLEKAYDLDLFVKPDHIRIYIGNRGWLRIARNGQINSFLHKSQEGKIMEKLTPEIAALLIKTKE